MPCLGFLVIAVAKIVLMLQIAIMMSFWMITIMLSGMMVPIICSFLPMRQNDHTVENSAGGLARLNKAMASFSMGQGRSLIWAVVAVILVGGGWQTTRLKVGDPTPGSPILWPDHTYNQDQAMINELFNASSETFVLYYDGEEGSVYDPVVLDTFERFDRHAEKLRRAGEDKRIHYVSICSPNYLHDAHIRFALRIGANAICEKRGPSPISQLHC